MTDKLKPRDTWPVSNTSTTVGAYARRSMGVHKQEQYALPKPPNAAGPRSYASSGPYVPAKDMYYRNDGNKHIKNRGIEST